MLFFTIKKTFSLICILTTLVTLSWSISTFAEPTVGSGFYEHVSDSITHSQFDSLNQTERRSIAFGIRAGISLSNMNFNKGYKSNAAYINSTWKEGYFAGAAILIPLPKRFSLTQEYVFSRTRGQHSQSEKLYTLDYLSIPLLISYSINQKLSIQTGPQFELLISGKEDLGGKIKDITKLTEERSVGWVLGLQYSVMSRLLLEARFMYGLNAIGINQRNARQEFKYELFQISGNFLLIKL
jgi:hypothetical protein